MTRNSRISLERIKHAIEKMHRDALSVGEPVLIQLESGEIYYFSGIHLTNQKLILQYTTTTAQFIEITRDGINISRNEISGLDSQGHIFRLFCERSMFGIDEAKTLKEVSKFEKLMNKSNKLSGKFF